jgi:hypothetical protein
MYGVLESLDLSEFAARRLTQIAVGEFQVQFLFHPEGSISVEGAWELRDEDGALVDHSLPNEQRSEYRLHRLLGQQVVRWEIDPPMSFSLTFANGLVLRVFDDSEQYESFAIQPGDTMA